MRCGLKIWELKVYGEFEVIEQWVSSLLENFEILILLKFFMYYLFSFHVKLSLFIL